MFAFEKTHAMNAACVRPARHASRLSVHRVEDFGADLRLDSVERTLALEGLAQRCAAQIAG